MFHCGFQGLRRSDVFVLGKWKLLFPILRNWMGFVWIYRYVYQRHMRFCLFPQSGGNVWNIWAIYITPEWRQGMKELWDILVSAARVVLIREEDKRIRSPNPSLWCKLPTARFHVHHFPLGRLERGICGMNHLLARTKIFCPKLGEFSRFSHQNHSCLMASNAAIVGLFLTLWC